MIGIFQWPERRIEQAAVLFALTELVTASLAYLMVLQGANELCDFGFGLSALVVLFGALPLISLAAAARTRQAILVCGLSFLAAPFLFVLSFGARSPVCGEHFQNESAAVANLRTITVAEVTYLSSAGTYGTIDQLIAAGLLDDRFRDSVARYQFKLTLTPDGYNVHANAMSSAGKYDFYSREDGVIHYSPDSKRAPRGKAGERVE